MGQIDNDSIMQKLIDHENLFLTMTATLSAISERLTNYPTIVSQTNENTNKIEDMHRRCTDIQATKKSRKDLVNQVKIGVIVGVIVCIVTVSITLFVQFIDNKTGQIPVQTTQEKEVQS
jgi:preprotein translocase subunit SecY